MHFSLHPPLPYLTNKETEPKRERNKPMQDLPVLGRVMDLTLHPGCVQHFHTVTRFLF